jgi:2-polyprenyl-3-methyl-5-hydroxy-6-metoxy-1,4-benzoquinol methylase
MIDFVARARQWDGDPEFIERGRKIGAAIRARIPLSKAMRALDVGCGTGQLSLPLAGELGHITCIDTSQGMLKVLEEKVAARHIGNVTTALHDLAGAGLGGRRFDLIMSSMTLHHIKDTGAILAAFAAHLVPGGWLCIADLDREDGSFHGAGVDVHHGFDRPALAQAASASGFEDISFDTVLAIAKAQEGVTREYPVFLLSARKSGRGPSPRA